MEIIAAVSRQANAPFTIEKLQLSEPSDNEVIVKILAVGICHTDLVAHAGVFPISSPSVLGHEGAGIVVKAGKNVSKVAVGDHVALSFASCGQCSCCQKNHPAYCRSFAVLNFAGYRSEGVAIHDMDENPIGSSFFGQSSFANYALAHQRNVVKVPSDISPEIVGPLGCGIQTGFGAVKRSLSCEQGSSLVIIGGGSVGLAAVMAGVVQGCKNIILIEPHESRRSLASELGATHTIDPINQDVETSLKSIAENGIDYALDTSGVESTMESVFNALASTAVYGLVGVPQKIDQKLPGTIMQFVSLGITFKGIIEGDSDPEQSIPELIEYYQKGQLPVDKLVKCFSIENINEAIHAQHRGECIKPVLLFKN